MARKMGNCRICRKKRKLDPHHIISRGRAKKIGRKELITNPGNIVWLCRKCHNQTTASLARYKMQFEGKEIEVLTITVAELEREISRLKEENKARMREVRKLAEDEILRKDSEISELEGENEELRRNMELLDSLSLEYQISRGTKKILKGAKREVLQKSRGIERKVRKGAVKRAKAVEKELKGAVKGAKKVGKDIRRKSGL